MNRLLSIALTLLATAATAVAKPNVLWIYVDDMSPWFGCYGDDTVPTPHVDRLAAEGTTFTRAFMPSPVCSTTRSALITGTMQTTLGLHHHRTMVKEPLPGHIKTVPELFRAAGYTTFNEAKEDYNFTRDRSLLYSPDFERPGVKAHTDGSSYAWLKTLTNHQPFFGQLQLKGGKIGGETGARFPAESRVSAESVTVPPPYPDHPVFRNAVARHYEQVALTDAEVGKILAALEAAGLLEDTAVFFFTDHGSPLPRAKQFLYDEGLHVPLVVRFPTGKTLPPPGARRDDLVSGLDIPATSLALAGISAPDYSEGIDLFAENFSPRTHVVGARDRCGIAVDRIRTIRTDHFRYLRNHLTDRPLYQPAYRDAYPTFRTLRELHAAGQLTPAQSTYHDPAQRPAEELYDLRSDPHQLHNLATDPAHANTLTEHRTLLATWTTATADQGAHPESRESLKRVYDTAKTKPTTPEFNFLTRD